MIDFTKSPPQRRYTSTPLSLAKWSEWTSNIHILLACVMLAACGGGSQNDDNGRNTRPTLRVGVLSAALQHDGFGADTSALEFARDNINAAGGVAGADIELVPMDWEKVYASYADFQTNPNLAVEDMLKDPTIRAVIGPFASSNVIAVGDLLIDAKVPMVTTAGSAAVMRAFGGKDYIWRTRESDIAQVEMMLSYAKSKNAQKIAMLAPFGSYGETFFDWFAFLASEQDMTVTSVVRHDMENDLNTLGQTFFQMLQAEPAPDMILLVPTNDVAFALLASVYHAYEPSTEIVFSDGAFWPDIGNYVEQLWQPQGDLTSMQRAQQALDGRVVISPASPPATGFDAALQDHVHRGPGPDFDASLYDALLLVAYGLAHSQGLGGDALVQGMKRAVSGQELSHGWDMDDIRENLAMIASGKSPDFRGASGTLIFDTHKYTEPVASTFSEWHIKAVGDAIVYEAKKFVTSGDKRLQNSVHTSALNANVADDDLLQTTTGSASSLAPAQKLWVFIAALSSGWSNYRHQADALAQYQFFKQQGVDDDHIVLVGDPSFADSSRNPLPGAMYNVAGGPNVHTDVQYDHDIFNLNAASLMDLLAGIGSDVDSNVYVFLVGHGGDVGAVVNATTPKEATIGPNMAGVLTPTLLANTLKAMNYRSMLIAIEACHSGVLGREISDIPHVLLLTAANPYENSLATNWIPKAISWGADEFSFLLWNTMTNNETENITIRKLYETLYFGVPGSHAMIYNASGFGDVSNVLFNEFLVKPLSE